MAVLVGAAFDVIVRALHRRLPQSGFADIRPVHCTNVFRLIDREGTRPGVLAGRAGVTPQAMGEFIAYLEDRGYLVKVVDPTDKRARLVRLTEKGAAAAAAARTALSDIEDRWLADVPTDQVAALRRTLQRLVDVETGSVD